MNIEQLIETRLKIINTVEPKSEVEDVVFYKYLNEDSLNIVLLPIIGIKNSLEKEDARKYILRKMLSKSFFENNIEESESISEVTLFSIDALSEVDHCFSLNYITLKFEYCSFDFNGNILLIKHYNLDKYLEDIIEADFNLTKNEIYYPSISIEKFFTFEINKPVLDDPRTIPYHTLYGMNTNEIRSNVLEFGLTDFDVPYKSITPVEKVNLYCYFNLKKHFFTSYAIIERLFAAIEPVSDINQINFLDYGCGPLTSGIAIADQFFQKTDKKIKINYLGIDRSKVMLEQAEKFSKYTAFSSLSSFIFKTTLINEDLEIFKKSNNSRSINVINFSYLFASETLNITHLINSIKDIDKTNIPTFVLYQNSINESKNKNWKIFKSNFDLISVYDADRIIKYYNKRSYNCIPKEELVKFEILKIITTDYTI